MEVILTEEGRKILLLVLNNHLNLVGEMNTMSKELRKVNLLPYFEGLELLEQKLMNKK